LPPRHAGFPQFFFQPVYDRADQGQKDDQF
jgi:hypothetical protein